MPNRSEIASALHGALLLTRLDRGAMAFFDRSQRGFWNSFVAALLILPAFLILLSLRVEDAQWEAAGWARILLIEMIGYVVAWVAFPLLMVPVARLLGRETLWLDFIVAYNWSQVLQYAFYFAIVLLIGGRALPNAILQLVAAAAIGVPMLYEGAVARIALDIPWTAAAMVVLIDFALGYALDKAIPALY
jgi:hypothetical protein